MKVAENRITPASPEWGRFLDRLYEKMEWTMQGDDVSTARWKCGKGEDRLFYAKQAAKEMGFDGVYVSACCDCEIIFNHPEKEER